MAVCSNVSKTGYKISLNPFPWLYFKNQYLFKYLCICVLTESASGSTFLVILNGMGIPK
jgi:hypothetical protein